MAKIPPSRREEPRIPKTKSSFKAIIPKASVHKRAEALRKKKTEATKKKAAAFLKIAGDFHLGDLPTEQRHPETTELAQLAQADLTEALRILHNIDLYAIRQVFSCEESLQALSRAVKETIFGGGRIFIYGCGATGRLAISLETIWRESFSEDKNKIEKVVGFMSGGDLALVHSIENFEDHPEFGARQVREIGFKKNDLLIACTEGGETPSVIGATEEAARISQREPWFLFCNPEEILSKKVARSRRVIQNKRIKKVSFPIGPMGLSGSTRLQATTVLQLAVGLALFASQGREEFIFEPLHKFIRFLEENHYSFLIPFIEAEAKAYLNGEFLLYESNAYSITVLTDTTERSPTFSLPGFENKRERTRSPALSYLVVPGSKSASDAWKKILHRNPRTLEWPVLKGVAGKQRLAGFDFSPGVKTSRKKRIKSARQHSFRIEKRNNFLTFRLGQLEHLNHLPGISLLEEHIFLKLLLNAHSLLVMGRLGRYESNVMTWVRPSNNKLIDRAIRYALYLLERQGMKLSYEQVAYHLFLEAEFLSEGQSVVLNTVSSLQRNGAHFD